MSVDVCWICGLPSQTREHRIKKSDLIEMFGRGPYVDEQSLIHLSEGRIRKIQGPDSQLVKFPKNLCSQCNNALTQPYDQSYEAFTQWINQNITEILKHRVIDFESVYGASWISKQRDLFKYFAKNFGCMLDDANCDVPLDIKELFNKESFETAFYVTFQVNESPLAHDLEYKFIGTEELTAHKTHKSANQFGFRGGIYYRFLTIRYWYHLLDSINPVGAKWVANSKHLYLGWHK